MAKGGMGGMGYQDMIGAAVHLGGMSKIKKGQQAGLSAEESGLISTMSSMFQDRAKDPFQYIMGLEEQKYYDKRELDIYGEDRERAQQSMMGAMNRSGTLASGATNYNLMRFGQQTLRDKQQFYFRSRQGRLQEKEAAVQNTYSMGLGLSPLVQRKTDMENANIAQSNAWKNRWAQGAMQMGASYMGADASGLYGGSGTQGGTYANQPRYGGGQSTNQLSGQPQGGQSYSNISSNPNFQYGF